MKGMFYTYALARTLFEEGQDYIDTFWPFVLKVLPEDGNAIRLASIQEKLKEEFGLDVPEHSLGTIIGRAESRRYIAGVGDRYGLTEPGRQYVDHLESESAVERRINALLTDIQTYLNRQSQLRLDIDEIHTILLSFVNEYLYPVIQFFSPTSEIVELDLLKDESREWQDELVRYFEVARYRKPAVYDTLQDIVLGSIISTVAGSSNIDEVDSDFRDTEAYLDSNLLFSVLGFHVSELSKPAKELLALLKAHRIDLKVFDFTIVEMVRVLRAYQREQYMYVPGVRVASIYSVLRSRGWTGEDVRLFIQKIDQNVQDLEVWPKTPPGRIRDTICRGSCSLRYSIWYGTSIR